MINTLVLRKELEDVAHEKCFVSFEYEEETKEIIEKWNSLVPKAESCGISHPEMNRIWNNERWGVCLKEA